MEYKILWGDIHNHNTVGLFHYTKGTLERAIDMAQSHLDFFAFTGHAQWHDMPEMPNNRHEQWQEGFDRHREVWPRTKELIKDATDSGQFEAFLGYEWHSAGFGDHCVIYKEDGPLQFANHVREIQEHARRSGALLVPHHPGYMRGFRGANWDWLDESVSPIVEIISEHGGAERDRGRFAYTRHGLGPRVTINTIQHALALGHHVGFTGSSDDHQAHPGAYNEGQVAVLVPEFTREAIWDALWSRRCYAASGDKIELDFRINGQPMGSQLPAAGEREIAVNVRGWDEMEKVEVIKNNRVIHRHFPADHEPAEGYPWSRRHRCRVEVGWGPWSAFGKPRIAEWDLTVTVDGARIHQAMPCFQPGPFDEVKRSLILESTATKCRFQTYTSLSECLNDCPQNSVVFDLEGPPSATVTLAFTKPMMRTETYTLEEASKNAITDLTTGFPSDSFLIHRLVPDELATAEYGFVDTPSEDRAEDYYYLRATQENGQVAWSSPIWVANT